MIFRPRLLPIWVLALTLAVLLFVIPPRSAAVASIVAGNFMV